MNVNHILEGIKNTVFVKEAVEKIADERYLVCSTCPSNSKNTNKNYTRPDEFCTECSCNLHLKLRSLQAACPLDKWKAEATEDQAELIDEAISNGDKNI